jgi:hypothetical protein
MSSEMDGAKKKASDFGIVSHGFFADFVAVDLADVVWAGSTRA